MALEDGWQVSFPDRSRPRLYTSTEIGDDGYYPLTDVNTFLLDDLAGLTSAQLYSLTANNAAALQLAQKEWTDLERLALQIKTRDPFSSTHKDPQALPDHNTFEERKEATLYNYNYVSNRRMLPARFTISENVTDQEKYDCREPPEPFSQAGLIPNERQLKSLLSTAKQEGREKNPDNQTSYTHNFANLPRPKGFWIAKQMPLEPPAPYKTRSRDAQLNGVAGGAGRHTRLNGERLPSSRGFSEIPSGATSPNKRGGTPMDSPASKKRRIDTVEIPLPPKKKHPNQYTKRREAEEAARAAAIAAGKPLPTPAENPVPVKKKHPNQYTKRREREEAERLARLNGTTLDVTTTLTVPAKPKQDAQSIRTDERLAMFRKMTKELLREQTFTDKELQTLVSESHKWLNDDPTKADDWRNKILSSENPVRALAMCRKWAHWQNTGQDKRPRRKVADAGTDEVGNVVAVEEEAKGVKRSARLRGRLEKGVDTPSLNGSYINGADVDASHPKTKLDNLEEMGIMDSQAKVGAWRQNL